MSVNPLEINIAIIGAGVHALTLYLHLLQKRKDIKDKVLAFDPSGIWMRQWNQQFAAQEILHLRSPAVHHPVPNPFALRKFAENRPQELFLHYDLPGTNLFDDFCQDSISANQISDRVIKAKVIDLDPIDSHCFQLSLDDGQLVKAKRVVLATNRTVRQLPDWVSRIETVYPIDRLLHSNQVDLRGIQLAGETILIVGGGLTSGHLAMGSIERGAKVILMSRRELKAKYFDAEPGWLGPKYLKGFEAEPSWENRRQMVISARDGGSMTPSMLMQLQTANHHKKISIHQNCQIQKAEWNDGKWQVYCEDGMKLECDRIWAATGTRFDVMAEPLLSKAIDKFPIPVVGGFPVIDRHLRWSGRNLFLMGGLAALQVGPTARNISGARMASDRIVPVLAKSGVKHPITVP